MRPYLVVLALLTLIAAQLLYAFWPYRRRIFLVVLLLTAAGVAGGQVWAEAGLPAYRIGEADVLPALVFAVALQPLASLMPRLPRLPIRLR